MVGIPVADPPCMTACMKKAARPIRWQKCTTSAHLRTCQSQIQCSHAHLKLLKKPTMTPPESSSLSRQRSRTSPSLLACGEYRGAAQAHLA